MASTPSFGKACQDLGILSICIWDIGHTKTTLPLLLVQTQCRVASKKPVFDATLPVPWPPSYTEWLIMCRHYLKVRLPVKVKMFILKYVSQLVT